MRPASSIETEIVERLARQIGAAPRGTGKKAPETKTQKEEGHARQEGGSRGRKAQEKQKEQRDTSSGAITNMNWEETVGASEESTGEEEQEEDPDERTDETNRDHHV